MGGGGGTAEPLIFPGGSGAGIPPGGALFAFCSDRRIPVAVIIEVPSMQGVVEPPKSNLLHRS